MDEFLDPPANHPVGKPSSARWVYFGLVALLGLAGLAFVLLQPEETPPPAEIAGDALLVTGRQHYRKNCINCHGESGKGDGPSAKGLSGPQPGNLTDPKTWRHGDRPEAIVKVIGGGSDKSAMPAFEPALGAEGVRALAAYVYYLARRPVPDSLRVP